MKQSGKRSCQVTVTDANGRRRDLEGKEEDVVDGDLRGGSSMQRCWILGTILRITW